MFPKNLTFFFAILILTTKKFQTTFAYVDLFLNTNETNSLIGYPGSYFYLFNGEIRQNSILHRLEIPDTKSHIEFNWKTTGPEQMYVDYNLILTDLNSTKRVHFITINSSGLVPSKLQSFQIQFNCSHDLNTSIFEDQYIDLVFNLSFKFNSKSSNPSLMTMSQYLASSIDLQLITMPPLNLSIQYRKYCSKKTHLSKIKKLSKQPKSSFTIAYLIFAILASFALLILLTCVYMYLNSKTKFKKSISSTINTSTHSKYESLNKRNKETKELVSCEETRSIRQSQFVKNSSSVKKCRQLPINQSLRVQSNIESDVADPSANIYETLPDQSVSIVTNFVASTSTTCEQMSKIANKSKLALNLTTNTIQSVSIPNMSITAGRKNLNQVELCAKYRTEQIEIGSLKMEGTFSKIYDGWLKIGQNQMEVSQYDNEEAEAGKQERIRVLIKKVSEFASQEQTDLMMKESCMFRGLKHKNLSTILGLCLDQNNKNPVALFNYFEIGNLKNYFLNIKKKRKNFLNDDFSSTSGPKIDFDDQHLISTQELLYIILQLLKGVNYLHSKHVVHKDIAARNCWLDTNFSLKLGDFALSRDMFPQDYHCLADNENKPINWMAVESLTNNVFNTRTDVWSCGVFVWECFTLAAQPYANIDPFEFTDYLAVSDTNRLERPTNCPQELFDVYSKCWSSMPTLRPSLKELFNSIHKFYNTLNNYV